MDEWIRMFKAPKERMCKQRIRCPLEIVHQLSREQKTVLNIKRLKEDYP